MMTNTTYYSILTIAHLLLRNFVTLIFSIADKSLIHYSQKYKLFQSLRCIISSLFLFFLRLLHSLLCPKSPNYPSKHNNTSASTCNNSTVSRSLFQLLQLMTDIPVSSRKYDVVRTLADKFIDENISHGNQSLLQVNCIVLSSAFDRSLRQLEDAMEQGRVNGVGELAVGKDDSYYVYSRVIGFMRGVIMCYGTKDVGVSAAKLAAEALWLAQKMKGSGCVEEAVWKWASAEKLGWMALSAEPRLQGSLVKVTAYLIKQAKGMSHEEQGKDATLPSEHTPARKTKLNMLLSWLPLLCHANNGIDFPVLNAGEREELERTLEEIIAILNEEEQEQVLSTWLHHFSHCPVSDWPNLHTCYARWFNASRHRFLLALDDAPVK